MAAATNKYSPDCAVSPGLILEEHLEAKGISHAEFARRCGCSSKLTGAIVSVQAPLEQETALKFEKARGVDADIRLGIKSEFRLRPARKTEARNAAASAEWVKNFSV